MENFWVCHDSFMFELVLVWELHVGREREFVFIFQGFLCFLSEYMHFNNIATNSSLWVLVFVSSLVPTWYQKILDGDVRDSLGYMNHPWCDLQKPSQLSYRGMSYLFESWCRKDHYVKNSDFLVLFLWIDKVLCKTLQPSFLSLYLVRKIESRSSSLLKHDNTHGSKG